MPYYFEFSKRNSFRDDLFFVSLAANLFTKERIRNNIILTKCERLFELRGSEASQSIGKTSAWVSNVRIYVLYMYNVDIARRCVVFLGPETQSASFEQSQLGFCQARHSQDFENVEAWLKALRLSSNICVLNACIILHPRLNAIMRAQSKAIYKSKNVETFLIQRPK